jgi:formate hydrogenlyase transcriptional activator
MNRDPGRSFGNAFTKPSMMSWKSGLEGILAKARLRQAKQNVAAEAHEPLRDTELKLKLAMEAASVGYWETDVATGRVIWSESMQRILGLVPGAGVSTLEDFMDRVHADDRERLQLHSRDCIQTLGSDQFEFRIVRPDGAVHWLSSRGQALADSEGHAARVLGMAVDITERKRVEEKLQRTLEEVRRLKENTEAENRYLREEVSGVYRFGQIVSISDAIRHVLKQAEQVAITDTSVLITGETGTGKELLARAVHARSRRSDRPLIKLNCTSLPASLVESEFFGHEKGAFTGATTKRVGRFELADNGTIFLDEIGELPLELQSKLLRVLQEGEFEPVGSSRTIKVNVRVIVATNRDLGRAVREQSFREDLYAHLNVYPINMPPLRQRKEDIGLLAATFLNETSRRLGRSFPDLPQRVIETLKQYDWPGNVRELHNVLEHAAVISPGPILELPERWQALKGERVAEHDIGVVTLKELVRGHIIRVLQRTHWRIEGAQGAAAILGINPSTLRSRMQKLEIHRPERTLAE